MAFTKYSKSILKTFKTKNLNIGHIKRKPIIYYKIQKFHKNWLFRIGGYQVLGPFKNKVVDLSLKEFHIPITKLKSKVIKKNLQIDPKEQNLMEMIS